MIIFIELGLLGYYVALKNEAVILYTEIQKDHAKILLYDKRKMWNRLPLV